MPTDYSTMIGPELSAAIARAMGWRDCDVTEPVRTHLGRGGYVCDDVPYRCEKHQFPVEFRPHSDANDLFRVVDWMRDQRFDFFMRSVEPSQWQVVFDRPESVEYEACNENRHRAVLVASLLAISGSRDAGSSVRGEAVSGEPAQERDA